MQNLQSLISVTVKSWKYLYSHKVHCRLGADIAFWALGSFGQFKPMPLIGIILFSFHDGLFQEIALRNLRTSLFELPMRNY